jgi:hypothetical protein
MSGSRALGAAALVALVLLGPTRARANAGIPYAEDRRSLGGAVLTKATSLVVDSEDLTFRCAIESCDFRATYHVRNPGDAREEVFGVFYGGPSDQSVTVRAGGADIRKTVPPEAFAATDATVRQIDPSIDENGLARGFFRRTGFDLAVDAGQSLEVVFEGRIDPYYADVGEEPFEFVFPALMARHPYMMTKLRRDIDHKYKYALSPIRSWGGSPFIAVSIVLDRGTSWNADDGGWQVTTEGGATVARKRIASADASMLRFSYRRAGNEDRVLDGGPLVGIGGRLDAPDFRMRAGWEVGYTGYLVGSAVVESNFTSRVTFVPTVEAATPNIVLIIPAIAAGLGLPVQLHSGAAPVVGVRIQGTLSFPFLSLVFPVDYFPAGRSGEQWQLALMGQVSF